MSAPTGTHASRSGAVVAAGIPAGGLSVRFGDGSVLDDPDLLVAVAAVGFADPDEADDTDGPVFAAVAAADEIRWTLDGVAVSADAALAAIARGMRGTVRRAVEPGAGRP